MTKQKQIMLGALAAIGGILLYARAKKKRDLLNSGADDLTKSFMATVEGGDSWTGEGEVPTVNLPSGQLTVEEWLSMKKS